MISKIFNRLQNIGLGMETTNSVDAMIAMAGVCGIGLMTGNLYVAAAGLGAFTAGATVCQGEGQRQKSLVLS